jgi:mono/diheme cytochrome c family protein
MRRSCWRSGGAALGAAVLFAAAGTRGAADPPVQTVTRPGGGVLFKTYCASCHGVGAGGDGPLAAHLRTAPPDLTLLARRDRGRFDADKVYRIIDGRRPVKNHGGPDMPVWGDAFKESREGYSEARVKERIEALVEHLRSIQQPKER